MKNLKHIVIELNKEPINPKIKVINKAVELFEILWYNAMSKEIKEGKQTVQNTCDYLLKHSLKDKERQTIKQLFEISKECKL